MIPVVRETKSHDTGKKSVAGYYTRYREDTGAAMSSKVAHEHCKRSAFAGSRNQVTTASCIQATSYRLYPDPRQHQQPSKTGVCEELTHRDALESQTVLTL
ncbi:hypothetical protein NDU88_006765 [Pleurodeles waltl]|uniref:Uncharacterized protein n=1 Tax=Pleurodeles waltl TaxID=8319 RepID=A0AAV7MD62_PLEWA|nr:hypothetical protein NDU88_006765 [Pleurodeles waltl]